MMFFPQKFDKKLSTVLRQQQVSEEVFDADALLLSDLLFLA